MHGRQYLGQSFEHRDRGVVLPIQPKNLSREAVEYGKERLQFLYALPQ
jgi:hypothetical protein